MGYTLEQLAADLRTSLAAGPTADALEAARHHVERALADAAFVARNLPDRAPDANPREILYEDKDLGFCICGHVYPDKAYGKPHDHGTSWAIYGQASGVTEMTDWRIVEQGRDGRPTLVEPVANLRPRAGQGARLRHRGGAQPAPREDGQADPHRRRQPRPHEALQHQGEGRGGEGVGRSRRPYVILNTPRSWSSSWARRPVSHAR